MRRARLVGRSARRAIRASTEPADARSSYQSFLRKLSPFAIRTELLPREDTDTRPARFETLGPDRDRLSALPLPNFTRLRHTRPMG